MHPLGSPSQVARRVRDLALARTFLRDRLGLRELYAFPGLAFFDLGGAWLMLCETGRREEANHLCLRVPDISFLQPPHLIHSHPDGGQEWMAFTEEDEGRPLALHAITGP